MMRRLKLITLRSSIAAMVLAACSVAANAAPVSDPTIATAVADPGRPDKERALDATRHPVELLAFLKIKAGDTVADIWPGDYWDRLFASVVGPTGKVYAVHLLEADQAEKEVTPPAGYNPFPDRKNVIVAVSPASMLVLPAAVDLIWIRQNYHDLYDKFMGPVDVAAFNKRVYDALKPGGRFVVIDHAAAPGSKLAATDTLHRIDPEAVKADMAAAGFKFVGESDVLANPADPRTANVFDPSIRGHTDQFVYVFQRP